ncbi:hypothetical protein N136_00424 [Leifsonia aquatica ATCC 14665]|uniref:Uncharacterized protein n=2 Tax=Leifsonia aquatica TaxID=144185 RepID=U2TEW4_LEIAQ|nr:MULTISPECIES: hypothetical protein [Leifsonia]ERK73232.1 hypothetical protein N136_00424 [Leifsonia aquatica ATCC 14665]MBB2969272.1 putative membrane protein [Leifsonia aquatica]
MLFAELYGGVGMYGMMDGFGGWWILWMVVPVLAVAVAVIVAVLLARRPGPRPVAARLLLWSSWTVDTRRERSTTKTIVAVVTS